MAVRAIAIHPSALAELKAAIAWYLERNETAALRFAAEVDRAIELITNSPGRWPSSEGNTRKFVLRSSLSQSSIVRNMTASKCWQSLTVTDDRRTGKSGADTSPGIGDMQGKTTRFAT